jgi:hypothetical protein
VQDKFLSNGPTCDNEIYLCRGGCELAKKPLLRSIPAGPILAIAVNATLKLSGAKE